MFRGPKIVSNEDELITYLEGIDLMSQPLPVQLGEGVVNFDPMIINGHEFWLPSLRAMKVLREGGSRKAFHEDVSGLSNDETISYVKERWRIYLDRARKDSGRINELRCTSELRYWGVKILWSANFLTVRVDFMNFPVRGRQNFRWFYSASYHKFDESELLKAIERAIAVRRFWKVMRSTGRSGEELEDVDAFPSRYIPNAIPGLHFFDGVKARINSRKSQFRSQLPLVSQIEGYRISADIQFLPKARGTIRGRAGVFGDQSERLLRRDKAFSLIRPALVNLWFAEVAMELEDKRGEYWAEGMYPRFLELVLGAYRKFCGFEKIGEIRLCEETENPNIPEGCQIWRDEAMPGWVLSIQREDASFRHHSLPDADQGRQVSFSLAVVFANTVYGDRDQVKLRQLPKRVEDKDLSGMATRVKAIQGVDHLVIPGIEDLSSFRLMRALAVPLRPESKNALAEIMLRLNVLSAERSSGKAISTPSDMQEFFEYPIERWMHMINLKDWQDLAEEMLSTKAASAQCSTLAMGFPGLALSLNRKTQTAGIRLPSRQAVLLELSLESKCAFDSGVRLSAAVGRLCKDQKIMDGQRIRRLLNREERVPAYYDFGSAPNESLYYDVKQALESPSE